jgi:hypothetical protein
MSPRFSKMALSAIVSVLIVGAAGMQPAVAQCVPVYVTPGYTTYTTYYGSGSYYPGGFSYSRTSAVYAIDTVRHVRYVVPTYYSYYAPCPPPRVVYYDRLPAWGAGFSINIRHVDGPGHHDRGDRHFNRPNGRHGGRR